MNQKLSKNVDFTNAAKSLISNKLQEKWDGKVTWKYIFQNKFSFSIFFALYSYVCKKSAQSSEYYCYYIPYVFNV